MLCLKENTLLKFTPNILETLRKWYGFENIDEMNKAIDVLEQWIEKQQHFLVKKFDRELLEKIIITCKGSIERAKVRLDKKMTMKTLLPKYFGDYDVEKDFDDLLKHVSATHLPQQTKDFERVFLIRIVGKDIKSSVFLDCYRYCLMISEYILFHDYVDRFIIIVDIRDASLSDILLNLNVLELREALLILMEGCGMRVKEIHLITSSTMVETFLGLLKKFLSEKIMGRVHTHKAIDTLYKYVPQEMFPKEYGGNEKTMVELVEEWVKELSSEEFRSHIREVNKAGTDESLRQRNYFDEDCYEYMGMPGSFKKLTVD